MMTLQHPKLTTTSVLTTFQKKNLSPNGYLPFKEPSSPRKDDFGNRYEKLLQPYQKEVPKPAEPKSTAPRSHAKQKNLLFTMSGSLTSPQMKDVDIESTERQVFTYDSMVFDEVQNFSGNLQDALFGDYDIDATEHRKSPHDTLMRNIHATKAVYREEHTIKARKQVNTYLEQGRNKIIRRDYALVQKYRSKIQAHLEVLKAEDNFGTAETMLEQSQHIPQPADFKDNYRPTEFLLHAPGLY